MKANRGETGRDRPKKKRRPKKREIRTERRSWGEEGLRRREGEKSKKIQRT